MAKKWPFLTILLGKWRYFGSKMAQKGGNMTVFLGHFWPFYWENDCFWPKKGHFWPFFGGFLVQKGGNMTVFLPRKSMYSSTPAKKPPFFRAKNGPPFSGQIIHKIPPFFGPYLGGPKRSQKLDFRFLAIFWRFLKKSIFFLRTAHGF